MLLTIAMVHIDRPATVAVNLLVLSTAVAACHVLLMVNDRPFAASGITVQPMRFGPGTNSFENVLIQEFVPKLCIRVIRSGKGAKLGHARIKSGKSVSARVHQLAPMGTRTERQ